MEEVIDFDKWVSEYTPPVPRYVAVYNPSTGTVTSVGPSHAFENEKHKIEITADIAEAIVNSEIKIHHCFVDMNSKTLEIAEVKNVFKIDDVLHRIISNEYFAGEKIDLYLSHNATTKTLEIQLSEEMGGTYSSNSSAQPRGIIWDGDTEMKFFVTDFNDPNLIFEMFSVKINDLIGKTTVINNVDYASFSVYTRRLFKNYVIEYK